ncbi:MAG: helix-turn-helix domain-containing protein [Treponema sp.]|nr:helix-turn-helix domain-containing protein [Treponema sp.]
MIKISMGFWQNVEDECDYLGITRKELAEKAGFSVHTISNGIKRDGMPAADLALRISKVLNVPLEKLLGEKDFNKTTTITESETQKQDKKLFSKYLPLVKKINQLEDESKKAVLTIIEKLK